jgi:hypothetical protein
LATVTATLCSQFAIPNPAQCEVHAVIRFLYAKGETGAVIRRQLLSVYGEDVVMNRQNVAKWCREFEAMRSNDHDEIKSGRPSDVTDEIIQKIDGNIHADRRLTMMNFIDNVQKCQEMSETVRASGAENVDRRSQGKIEWMRDRRSSSR